MKPLCTQPKSHEADRHFLGPYDNPTLMALRGLHGACMGLWAYPVPQAQVQAHQMHTLLTILKIASPGRNNWFQANQWAEKAEWRNILLGELVLTFHSSHQATLSFSMCRRPSQLVPECLAVEAIYVSFHLFWKQIITMYYNKDHNRGLFRDLCLAPFCTFCPSTQ